MLCSTVFHVVILVQILFCSKQSRIKKKKKKLNILILHKLIKEWCTSLFCRSLVEYCRHFVQATYHSPFTSTYFKTNEKRFSFRILLIHNSSILSTYLPPISNVSLSGLSGKTLQLHVTGKSCRPLPSNYISWSEKRNTSV